jgi:hypothetical protein
MAQQTELEKAKKKLSPWQQITLSRRRMVFFYNILWIVLMLVFGVYLITANNCADPKISSGCIAALFQACCKIWVKYKLFFNCMWMGAMGGLTISLKGVYDHGNPVDPWKDAYNLWHIGRPFSGAVAGLIAALLFMVIFPTVASPLVIYGVAFIFGTQDAAFFDFLSSFAARFLPKSPSTGAPATRIAEVHPTEGKPGTPVTITGQSFDRAATVKLGGVRLDNLTISADGTAANGKVPNLGAEARKVDVAVVNPNDRGSAVLFDKFDYKGP